MPITYTIYELDSVSSLNWRVWLYYMFFLENIWLMGRRITKAPTCTTYGVLYWSPRRLYLPQLMNLSYDKLNLCLSYIMGKSPTHFLRTWVWRRRVGSLLSWRSEESELEVSWKHILACRIIPICYRRERDYNARSCKKYIIHTILRMLRYIK